MILTPKCHIIPVQSYSGMNIEKGKSERVLNKEVLIVNFAPPHHITARKLAEQTDKPLQMGLQL